MFFHAHVSVGPCKSRPVSPSSHVLLSRSSLKAASIFSSRNFANVKLRLSLFLSFRESSRAVRACSASLVIFGLLGRMLGRRVLQTTRGAQWKIRAAASISALRAEGGLFTSNGSLHKLRCPDRRPSAQETRIMHDRDSNTHESENLLSSPLQPISPPPYTLRLHFGTIQPHLD